VFIAVAALLFFTVLAIFTLVFCSRLSDKKRNTLRGDNTANYSSGTSKENQWKALKMIMAERAADCLAKLGLDTQPVVPFFQILHPHPHPSSTPSHPDVIRSSGGEKSLFLILILHPAEKNCSSSSTSFIRGHSSGCHPHPVISFCLIRLLIHSS
jgi:hypothetical protein